jgi:hypothetical protein
MGIVFEFTGVLMFARGVKRIIRGSTFEAIQQSRLSVEQPSSRQARHDRAGSQGAGLFYAPRSLFALDD